MFEKRSFLEPTCTNLTPFLHFPTTFEHQSSRSVLLTHAFLVVEFCVLLTAHKHTHDIITPHTNTHLIKSFLVRFVFLYMIKFLKQKKETKTKRSKCGKSIYVYCY